MSKTSALERVKQALRQAGSKNQNGDDWTCPSHDDGSASLTVKYGKKPGKIVLKCGKCSTPNVLEAIGLDHAALFFDPDHEFAKPVGEWVEYVYTNEEGDNLFRVRRRRLSNGKKETKQDRYTGRGWAGSLGDARRVLYQLPALRTAIGKGWGIHLTEGESDAEALNDYFKSNKIKARATCHPMGAGKWRPEYAEMLAGAASVVVWADRDAPGYRCCLQRLTSVRGAGLQARAVFPVPDDDKADARDHLAAGHSVDDAKPVTMAELEELTAEAAEHLVSEQEQRAYERLHAEHRAKVRFQADLVEQRNAQNSRSRHMSGESFFLDIPEKPPTLWGLGNQILWIDGEPLMIAGDDGTGKSTLAHQLIACRLGIRSKLLGFSVEPADGRIVYLAMDRPEQARRAGARLFPKDFREEHRKDLRDRLAVWQGPLPVDVLRSPVALADWIRQQFGSDVSEVHADSLKDISSRLSDDAVGSGINSAIQELIARGINWVGLHHQRKANGENKKPDSLADIYGSRWLVAGHGSVLMLVRPGDDNKDVIEIRQLKEPMDKLRPMLAKHDRVNGRTSVIKEVDDVEGVLQERGEEGATIGEVAAALYGKEMAQVSQAEKKAAERKLNGLVFGEKAKKQAAQRGGEGGSKPARYFIADGPA